MGFFLMVPFSLFGMGVAVVLGLVLLAWIGEAVLTALIWAFSIGLGLAGLVFLFRWIYRDKTPWHLPQVQPPPPSPPEPFPRVPRGSSPSMVIIEGVQIVVQSGANLHIHLHAGGGEDPPNVRVVPSQSRPVRPQGEPAKPSPKIIPPQNGRGPTFGDWNDRYGGGDDDEDD